MIFLPQSEASNQENDYKRDKMSKQYIGKIYNNRFPSTNDKVISDWLSAYWWVDSPYRVGGSIFKGGWRLFGSNIK